MRDALARFDDPRRLREEFEDAVAGLAHSLARQGDPKTAQLIVAEAWAKFQQAKASIQAKHQVLIDALSVHGSDDLATPARSSGDAD